MPVKFTTQDADFETRFDALLNSKREMDEDVDQIVSDIIKDVRKRGDQAVVEYTNKFDRMEMTADSMRISPEDLAAAVDQCEPHVIEALKFGGRPD